MTRFLYTVIGSHRDGSSYWEMEGSGPNLMININRYQLVIELLDYEIINWWHAKWNWD